MDTRFNSFYHEDMHPFVDAMVGLLQESGARARRPAVVTYFMRSAQQKYDADIALLKRVAKEVVAERKANPNDKKDLLNAMIKGRDPKTGEGLTEASVLNNMITFLIAGKSSFLLSRPLLMQFRPRNNQWPAVVLVLQFAQEPSSIPSSAETSRRGCWSWTNQGRSYVKTSLY
jgi:hypothetical protein